MNKIKILDGGMGSSFINRGIKLPEHIWSSWVNLEAHEKVYNLHKDYINAGADYITTNTFRTTPRAYRKVGLSDNEAKILAKTSLKTAVSIARKTTAGNIKILGSIAPLEDCYTPELFPESDTINEEESNVEEKPVNINFKPTTTHETKTSFDEFVDERILVSHNAFGDKEMKIKILEVSDEIAPLASKFGDRIKINKIIITIKHLQTQQIEEGEFDIESIERELIEKRHYTSTNRWVPTEVIKNGYVTNSRHTALISDAAALDYITF